MQFANAVTQAKLTGILLALYLFRSDFAKNRAITITGFSLGGVATMHCLRMLHMLHTSTGDPKAGMILNDAHLWAGAYVINMTGEYEEQRERSKTCTVVNGNLNNCWSDKDSVLKNAFTLAFPGMKCIGLYPIFTEIKPEHQDECKMAVNYDCTNECPGHSEYGPNAQLFMRKVKDAY